MKPLFVLHLLICYHLVDVTIGDPDDPILTSSQIQDTFGNSADSYSNISWGSIPDGERYHSDVEYNYHGFDFYYNLMHGFVTFVQPNDFTDAMSKAIHTRKFSWNEICMYEIGFLVCLALGVLLIVIMPLAGCIAWCCHCCSEKRREWKKKVTYQTCLLSSLLLICTAFILFGTICMFVTNHYMTDSLENIVHNLLKSIGDFPIFAKNIYHDMKHVWINGIVFTKSVLQRDLSSMGYLIGIPTRSSLQKGIGFELHAARDSIVILKSEIGEVIGDMESVWNSIERFRTQGGYLNKELHILVNATLVAQSLCPKPCADNLYPRNLSSDVDFDQLPDISSDIKTLKTVRLHELIDGIRHAKAKIDVIPRAIQDITDTMVNNNISNVIEDAYADWIKQFTDQEDSSQLEEHLLGYTDTFFSWLDDTDDEASDDKNEGYSGYNKTSKILDAILRKPQNKTDQPHRNTRSISHDTYADWMKTTKQKRATSSGQTGSEKPLELDDVITFQDLFKTQEKSGSQNTELDDDDDNDGNNEDVRPFKKEDIEELEPLTYQDYAMRRIRNTIEDYDLKRWIAFIVIGCITGVIGLLQLLGLTCGNLGESGRERTSCVANTGAKFLLAASVLTFLSVSLLTIILGVLFTVGGNLEAIVCRTFSGPEYKVFDLFAGNDDIQEFREILRSCEQDLPIWNIIQMDDIFDGEKTVKVPADLVIDPIIDSLDLGLSGVVLVSNDSRRHLQNCKDVMNSIGYRGIIDELSKNTTAVDLKTFEGDLRSLNESYPDNGFGEVANNLSIISAPGGIYEQVNNIKIELLQKIEALNISTQNITVNVDGVLDKAESVQSALESQASSGFREAVQTFKARLDGVRQSFVNYFNKSIQNDIAKCQPLSNIYKSMIEITLCDRLVTVFNGFWFGLGICIFFLVSSLVCNFKLAKYIRKMNHSDEGRRVKRSRANRDASEMEPLHYEKPRTGKKSRVDQH